MARRMISEALVCLRSARSWTALTLSGSSPTVTVCAGLPPTVRGRPTGLKVAPGQPGQVRVTRKPKRALGLPSAKTLLTVSLRGEEMTVPWDPRLGPDKERSGLIRLGKGNMVRLIGDATTMIIEKDTSGLLVLD